MKECQHDSRLLYEKLIGSLRAKAKELGYALAVHGSLKRDIDLIACPWTKEAVDARTLAEALRKTAAEHNGGWAFINPREDKAYFRAGQPGDKPHGRLCWSFHLRGGPYIDLSVMPRTDPPSMTGEEIVAARARMEQAEKDGLFPSTMSDFIPPQKDDAV